MIKIFIVEDDNDKLALVKSLVLGATALKVTVESAKNGLEARQGLSREQFDLLIVDISLPLRTGDTPDEKGGLNLLVELERSDRFLKPTNVVALTGFPNLKSEFESKFNNGLWSIDLYDPGENGWRDRLTAKINYIAAAKEQSAGSSYWTDVCILTALPTPELDFVRRIPWNFGAAEAFDTVNYKYAGEFTSAGRKLSVNAMAAPRMGLTASATLAAKAIAVLRPRILVMAGICAGLRDITSLGDVIVADPTWDWQMGKYTSETFEIAPDQIPAAVEITQRFGVLAQDKHQMLSISDKFNGDKPNSLPAIRTGPMASGSAVIASEEIVEAVKKQNRKLMAFDMEMYAVYSAARDSALPRPLVFGLKGVCDHADPYKNDKYQSYASHMCAGVLQVFLETYAAELVGS